MKNYKYFLLNFFVLMFALVSAQTKLPPLPGSSSSNTEKPKTNPSNDKSKNSTASNESDDDNVIQENKEYYIKMEAAMRQLVINSIKNSLYIVKQDYILESRNGEKKTQSGKTYFGRNYHIAMAANNKLWTTTSLLSPWVEDPSYNVSNQEYKPVRTNMGIRRLDIDRSMREVSMLSRVYDNQYLGFYEYNQPIPYAATTTEVTKSEGRLLMFYVENGQDPETAEIKSLLYNIDPDWDTKGKIRNPIPSFKDKTFLGGVYLVEDRTFGSATANNSKRNKKESQEQYATGIIQFKLAGFYQRQGNDQYIAIINIENNNNSRSSKKSSRSYR